VNYPKVENISISSISDAIDKLHGKPCVLGYGFRKSRHAMVSGRASTINIVCSRGTLNISLEPISILEFISKPQFINPVLVMNVISTQDVYVAGLGGLIALNCVMKGFKGAIVDGAIRDLDEIVALDFPVWYKKESPLTFVNRLLSVEVGKDIFCGGVPVGHGDLIVADTDGAVCIPREKEREVLCLAEEIEIKEVEMAKVIRRTGSIGSAIKEVNRI
jgi:regulator of RNase E activity RraA